MKKEEIVGMANGRRIVLDMSIRQLAHQCGVGFSTLSRLFRGKGEASSSTVKKLRRWVEEYDQQLGEPDEFIDWQKMYRDLLFRPLEQYSNEQLISELRHRLSSLKPD